MASDLTRSVRLDGSEEAEASDPQSSESVSTSTTPTVNAVSVSSEEKPAQGQHEEVQFDASNRSQSAKLQRPLPLIVTPPDVAAAAASTPIAIQPQNQQHRQQQQRQDGVATKGILEIDAVEPHKTGEGLNAHVVYTVSAKRLLESGTVRHESVLRRYSDFSWLRQRLIETFAGCIVAPLPEKTMLNRFTPEFLERRRRGLSIFLKRIAKHHVLGSSKDVEVFVSASEQELDAYRNSKCCKSPSASWIGYLSHIGKSMQSSWSGAASSQTDDDVKCDAINEYASSLSKSLSSCKNNTSAVVRGSKDLAQAWFEFGLSFTLHGQFESQTESEQEGPLSRSLSHLGHCADRISVLLSDKSERETAELLDPIGDYCRLVDAVQEMMKGREAAVVSHTAAVENVDSQRAKLEGARSKGRVGKIPELEAKLRRAEEESLRAAEHLHLITKDVFEEVERFRDEKERAIRSMIVSFVKIQLSHSQKMCGTWKSVLDQVER